MVYVDPEKRSKALTKLNTLKRVGITDAGFILGLHKVTIRDYIDKGKLDAITISGRDYVSSTEIDRFLQEKG